MNNSESDENEINKKNGYDCLKQMLTRLQESAKLEPIKVACTVSPPDKPPYFGEEFHGKLTKEGEKRLLDGKVGRFLVRESFSNSRLHEYTLAFNYNNIHHVKLVVNPATYKFKVEKGNKEFSTVSDLMSDLLELFSSLNNRTSNTEKKEPYCKPHSFKMFSYKHPKWCDNCNQFLWGFFNQGLKCEDCNMSVHQTCKDMASLPCSKVVVAPRKISLSVKEERNSKRYSKSEVTDFKLPYINDCTYFLQCSRFLSAFNIRDTFVSLENKLTRCFCVNCIEKVKIYSKETENSKNFKNWTRFQFRQQKEGLKNWEVAFFAIKPQYISEMLLQCYNTETNDSSFDLIVAPSLTNTVKDMEKENWSYKFSNTQSGTFLYAQTVLEVLLAPNSFYIVSMPNTLDNKDEVHWGTKDKTSVFPVSVWVKIFEKNDCSSIS